MDSKNNFKPYVPADRISPELTVTSILIGALLAIVFGAANAYLGLKVGMTVSASIPAAVIAMGIIKMIMRKNSVLETNMVQTIGSAGESLAAGAIFTLPALFIWASEGVTSVPSIWEISLIALIGGILGIVFMVPLRNALIVQEHGVLPYPEGTACSEVILAGEKGGASAGTVFAGMGIAALFKFIVDGLKLVAGEVEVAIKGFAGTIGTQIYPAVMSVGYICGPKISSYMFSGGLLSWMVIIPLIVFFGDQGIKDAFANGGGYAIWGEYIKPLGAGALIAGGLISLIKSFPLIVKTFAQAVKGMGKGSAGTARTEKDMPFIFVIATVVVLTLVIWLVDIIPVSFIGAIIVVVFGFFFATVSSRMVGLVGSSNNPVSGMTIATVLVATLILKATGVIGAKGMISAIAIASIVCIVTAISGDTSQDLKTGYLLGATPVKQQIGELIGVAASALAIGGTLYLLNDAWGFGSKELGAPQASLMKTLIEGVMANDLAWPLIIAGACIAIVVELLRIPVLPFAIGIYLPVHLNACIMVGGVVRLVFDKMKMAKEKKDVVVNRGILFSSGMIAGEGLMGILLAVFAIFGIDKAIDLSAMLGIPAVVSQIGGLVAFALLIVVFLSFTLFKKVKNENE